MLQGISMGNIPARAMLTLVLCFIPNGNTQPLYHLPPGNNIATYHEGMTKCLHGLPDDQSGHDELVDLMKQHGMQDAWLAWKRYQSPWTWITGEAMKENIKGKLGADCGSITRDGEIVATTCSDTLPVLCAFRGIPCSQIYATAYCRSLDGYALLVSPPVEGWYTARAFCRNLGGDLASDLKTGFNNSAISTLLQNQDSNFHWVGIRRHLWRTTGYKSELQYMSNNQWDIEEPSSIGNCISLYRTGSRAYWRVTSCNSLYNIICNTRIEAKRITFPRLDAIEKPLRFQAAKGLTEFFSGNNNLSLTCATFANGSARIINAKKDDQEQLAKFMIHSNITSAWLPWKLSILSQWQWSTGHIYEGEVIKETGDATTCASLDVLLKKPYGASCHTKKHGYICQYRDRRPCWLTFQPYHCIQTTKSTVVIGTYIQSWFVAYSLCHHFGGQLAVIENQDEMRTILNFVKTHEHLKTKEFLFIALSQMKFEDPLSLTYRNIQHSYWNMYQPSLKGLCVKLQRVETRLFWHSADCTEKHSVICIQNEDAVITENYEFSTTENSEILPTVLQSEEATTLKNYQRNTMQNMKEKIIPAVLCPVVLILICIGLFWLSRKRWGPCKKQKKSSRYEDHNMEEQALLGESPAQRSTMPITPGYRTAMYQAIAEDMANFLQHLENKNLITADMKNEMLAQKNEEMLQNLLERSKCQQDASKIMDAVEEFLDLPQEYQNARRKLADFIKKKFATFHLFSSYKEYYSPKPLRSLYTDITWERRYGGPLKIASYKDLFEQRIRKDQLEEDQRKTLLFITGEPGAGKSSFIRYLSSEWAESPKKSLNGVSFHWDLILPIILGSVSKENVHSLWEKQLTFLSKRERFAVMNAIRNKPEATIIAIDGCDECDNLDPVKNMIESPDFCDVTFVLTMRTHALFKVRRLLERHEDQWGHIVGFSHDQIEAYIHRFEKEFGKKPQWSDRLIGHLQKSENVDLLQLALIPIRLQMMCISWSVEENLSNNLVDLYDKFVHHLPYHFAQKQGMTPIKEDEESLVREIAALAFSWDEEWVLITDFDEVSLMEKCPKHVEDIKKIGYITQFVAMECHEKSTWRFSHRTIQEYLAAYYVANFESKIEKLKEIIPDFRGLERNKTIITFLCGINSDIANSILSHVTTQALSEQECDKIVQLIMKFVSCYRHPSEIQLPLPRFIELDEDINHQFGNNLRILFNGANERNVDNNTVLTLRGPLSLLYKYEVGSIKTLIASIEDTEQNKHISLEKFKSLNKVTIDIIEDKLLTQEIEHDFARQAETRPFTDKEQIAMNSMQAMVLEEQPKRNKDYLYKCFKSLETRSLHFVCVKGRGVLLAIYNLIMQVLWLPTVAELEIVELDIVPDKDQQDFCNAVNDKISIKRLKLDIIKPGKPILSIKDDVDLELHMGLVKMQHVVNFSEHLDSAPNKPKLQLISVTGLESVVGNVTFSGTVMTPNKNAQTSPDEYGRHLALLLINAPKVKKLYLDHCFISKQVIERMVYHMQDYQSKYKREFKISKLEIEDNNLKGSGSAIAQLLELMSYLKQLDMTRDMLNDSDIEDIADGIKHTVSLKKLHIENNKFLHEEDISESGTPFAKLWKPMQELEIIELINCCISSHGIDNLIGPGFPENLRVLDLSFNDLSEGGLQKIAEHKYNLERLEALSVAHCNCCDVSDLEFFLQNLPNNLRHLDISRNKYDSRITTTIKHVKKHLKGINKLNIGTQDQYIERNLIRDELQIVNRKIDVYFNKNEHLERLYKIC